MIDIRSAFVIWVLTNFLRGFERADLIGWRQRSLIEIESQQPVIPVLRAARSFRRDFRGGEAVQHIRLQGCGRQGRLHGIGQFLIFEELDGLRLAVFGHREVLRGESFDGLAALIVDGYILDHQLRAAGERSRLRRRLHGRLLRLLSHGHYYAQDQN